MHTSCMHACAGYVLPHVSIFNSQAWADLQVLFNVHAWGGVCIHQGAPAGVPEVGMLRCPGATVSAFDACQAACLPQLCVCAD